MIEDVASGTAILGLTFACGLALVTYAPYAETRGWPVGMWFADYSSFPMVQAGVTLIAAPLAALIVLPWWTAVIVVFGGYFGAKVITRALKHNVQIIALIGLMAGWFASIIYVIP